MSLSVMCNPEITKNEIFKKQNQLSFSSNLQILGNITDAGEINLVHKPLLNKPLTISKAKCFNVIAFSGNTEGPINRGLIMHLAHLPSLRSCIGQFLDPETERFTQFLKDSRQTHWVINPLTPIGDDLCPYNSSGRFDRNKYFVNLNELVKPEYDLLKTEDLPDDIPTKGFTMEMLRAQKNPRFEKAFDNFKKLEETYPLKQEFNNFCKEEGDSWLNNNSIHEGIVNFVQSKGIAQYDWRTWPKELKMFPENTKGKSFEEKLDTLKEINIDGKQFDDKDLNKIEQFRFEQFLFDKQFKGFKKDLDSKGIKLFVDLAYAIGPDGKDVWANKNIVSLDKNNNYQPAKLTGCMPEPAYPYTQMWGQAVWNFDSPEFWDYQENSMKKILKEGCVRLDHFGGLINRGAIPARIQDKEGKDYSIYEAIEKHIDLLKPYKGIDGKEKTKADIDIWYPEWLEDVSKMTNSKGETLLDLYIRIANEAGLKPENAFIVEDLGGVCGTDTFKGVMSKYGDKLSGLRLPMAYGIENTIGSKRDLEGNPHSPWGKDVSEPENFAILSSSHDPPTMMETIETCLKNAKRDSQGNLINVEKIKKSKDENLKDSSYLMLKLLKEAGLPEKELKEKNEDTYYKADQKLLEWMYKKPAKHIQTTISDALGIYFRPNLPGFWNGIKDKFFMKQGKEAEFNFWGTTFPKGFLDRDDESGITPGYKKRADTFVNNMKTLFPPEKNRP
jgi:hypothetical protein